MFDSDCNFVTFEQSRSGETTIAQFIVKVDSTPIQRSLAPPSDQTLSKTEARDISTTNEADAQEGTQQAPSSVSTDLQVIIKGEFIGPKQDLVSKPRKENRRKSVRIQKQKSSISKLATQTNIDRDSLKHAHAELQVSRKDLQDSKPSHQEATSRKQNTYKELQEARKKLAASQDALTACKDELFRLQPIAQTPDSRVANEFENLCQQIVNWIETEVAIFVKAHPEYAQEHIFSIGKDNEAAQFMAQHPRGGEHLAASMIHCWLQKNLFGQNLSCLGLPAEVMKLLERVEQSMARLDPPRGDSDAL